jgi:ribulose bisphosphate carboxylase small subunit
MSVSSFLRVHAMHAYCYSTNYRKRTPTYISKMCKVRYETVAYCLACTFKINLEYVKHERNVNTTLWRFDVYVQ